MIAALLSLVGPAGATAAAHGQCSGHHHHRSAKGKVKHYCRQKARHRRCAAGGHHHHRVRGRRVHYCAARPAAAPTGFALPGPGTSSPAPADPAPSVSGPTAPLPTDPSPESPLPPPAAARLQATAREFTLTLSRPALPAGPAVIELLNRGEDPHDLRIRSGGDLVASIAETPAGERATGRVTLPAGSYTLFCSLPGHATLGMSATLAVTVP